jgi:hypothetical protein
LLDKVYDDDRNTRLERKSPRMSISSKSLDSSDSVSAVPVPSTMLAEVFAEVARLGIGEQLPEVIALTRELFGEFTIDISEDPEIHNCSYVTFNVRAEDSYNKAFERESEWIRRLPRRPTQAPGSFCLNVDFIE